MKKLFVSLLISLIISPNSWALCEDEVEQCHSLLLKGAYIIQQQEQVINNQEKLLETLADENLKLVKELKDKEEFKWYDNKFIYLGLGLLTGILINKL